MDMREQSRGGPMAVEFLIFLVFHHNAAGALTVVEGLRGGPLDGNLLESGRGVNAVVLLPTHPKVADLQHAVVSHQAVPRRQVPDWTDRGEKKFKLVIDIESHLWQMDLR